MPASEILATWIAGTQQPRGGAASSGILVHYLSITMSCASECLGVEFRQLIWQKSRVAVPVTLQDQVEHIMEASPNGEYYGAVLAFAGSLDSEETTFWEGCGVV